MEKTRARALSSGAAVYAVVVDSCLSAGLVEIQVDQTGSVRCVETARTTAHSTNLVATAHNPAKELVCLSLQDFKGCRINSDFELSIIDGIASHCECSSVSASGILCVRCTDAGNSCNCGNTSSLANARS
jgi:hypothetical protein